MRNSLRLGRVAGIEVRVHASWVIVFVLVTWSLAASYFPQGHPSLAGPTAWLLGVISALLLFIAVLLHELSHSLVARRRGLAVDSITLFVFGGVSNLADEPRRPATEFLLAGAGPLTSLILAGLAYAASLAVAGVNLGAQAVFEYLAAINALLALFNLIPGFPLDGGRVLHAVLWRATGDRVRATRIAGGVGQGVAYLFIFWGIWQFFAGNLIGGMWIAFIGWFLANAAEGTVRHVSAEQQFAGVTVADVMRRNPVAVESDVSVEDAVHSYLLAYNLRALPVVRSGRLLGVVTLADLGRVPRERWSGTAVGELVAHAAQLSTATPQQGIMAALEQMARSHAERLPVLEDGELVGMLSRSDVARYLQLRLLLGAGGDSSVRRAA